FGWLAAACALAGDMLNFTVIASLEAALLAFLVYNMRGPWRKRASVFLGDSGSMALGLVL
ncbi:MAG TPA: undecaprenyl/decaprenyl-phosphate alpha-N-acetylglucosaminyl 1-phosphate transferase, partial [Rhodospirillaceae bacterium]|nr:undecaprenyl/decaprenyl-phosphate alpha-N-acetylglucosaminyl 1-phosphate transferase [Rhodospirillaceae bacterium]